MSSSLNKEGTRHERYRIGCRDERARGQWLRDRRRRAGSHRARIAAPSAPFWSQPAAFFARSPTSCRVRAARQESSGFDPSPPEERMAPTLTKEAAQLLKNVEDMIKKIDSDYKKCEPQYRKVEADLQEAIDDKSEDELELFRPQMETVLKDLDRCIHSVKGALALLGNLRKDASVMAVKTD